MKQLQWELKTMMSNNRDGSFSTQESRAEIFSIIVNEAEELGMPRITLNSLLRERTLSKYVEKWSKEGRKPGVMKNRLSAVRWAAKHKNVLYKIPSNDKLGIPKRTNITNQNKAVQLNHQHLNNINNQRIIDSLRLQDVFGLRRAEAIKFNPAYADRRNNIKLKGSWCKGGRSRVIPIRTEHQRKLLNELKNRYGNNSLIPANNSYKQQKDVYKNIVSKIGLDKNAHGLRHNYAQILYKILTNKECPVCGGKSQKEMTKEERIIDRDTRLIISEELGHGRVQIVSIYIGS